jgi:hypothetical protein
MQCDWVRVLVSFEVLDACGLDERVNEQWEGVFKFLSSDYNHVNEWVLEKW